MSSLNQRINKKLDEVLMLMKEADSRRKIGRTVGNGTAARQLHSSIMAEANRRKKLSANDKRAKVKAGGGIRPAILEVLMKSRKDAQARRSRRDGRQARTEGRRLVTRFVQPRTRGTHQGPHD
jgi:hypothetical protein